MPSTETRITVHLPKLIMAFVLSCLLIVASLFMFFGLGTIWFVTGAATLFTTFVFASIAVITRRPNVLITEEGFVFSSLFESRSYRWEDLVGQFKVIRVGLIKMVAFKLTESCKERMKKKPSKAYQGYDDALVGALQLSPERLAEVLNKSRKA